MPDETSRLLDAWGRRQSSAAELPGLGRSPSPGYLGAVRRARIARRAVFVAAAAAAMGVVALIVMLIVWATMRQESRPAVGPEAPLRVMDR